MAFDCDVVIAGASYAGLAAARHLGGWGARVLLVDEHAIGAIRHSACAVPTRVLDSVGGMDSACQETDRGVVHAKFTSVRFRWPEPWTVFDHQALCLALRAQAPDVPFLRARVVGFDGVTLVTNRGAITARHFVDATGWRAVLASALDPAFVDPDRLTVGIEVSLPGRTDALHFYVDQEIVRHGYGWIFPSGDERRIGLVAFDNARGMAERLRAFLARLGLTADPRQLKRNGGFLPWQVRPAAVGGLWVLGDAAGACLPLTGEGIRFALRDGDVAGRLIRHALGGAMNWQAAQDAYAIDAGAHRARVSRFGHLQALTRALPNAAYTPAVWAMGRRSVHMPILRRYLAWDRGSSWSSAGEASPTALEAAWADDPDLELAEVRSAD